MSLTKCTVRTENDRIIPAFLLLKFESGDCLVYVPESEAEEGVAYFAVAKPFSYKNRMIHFDEFEREMYANDGHNFLNGEMFSLLARTDKN